MGTHLGTGALALGRKLQLKHKLCVGIFVKLYCGTLMTGGGAAGGAKWPPPPQHRSKEALHYDAPPWTQAWASQSRLPLPSREGKDGRQSCRPTDMGAWQPLSAHTNE